MTDTSSEIICSLSEPEFRNRKDLIKRELAPYLTKATYTAGISHLAFSKPEVARDMLEHMMELESECCPFLSFDLTEADMEFKLIITGPKGSEDIVRNFFDASSETGCGCSVQNKTAGLKKPKNIVGLVSLCAIACAAPPVLAALGFVSVATSAWLGRGIEAVLIGIALFGIAYFLVQNARSKRRKV